MSNISDDDGTLHQSIKWTSFYESHRITSASVNINHTVIPITTAQNENTCYSENLNRSSQRCKRCAIPEDFSPTEEIQVDATLAYCICTEFLRCTLNVSLLLRHRAHLYANRQDGDFTSHMNACSILAWCWAYLNPCPFLS